MKKIILFIMLVFPLIAQNPWHVVREATLDYIADSGYFFNENLGWLYKQSGAGITKGAIYHTSDGGTTWIIQKDTSSRYQNINNVYFYDAMHGWACGDTGTVLYTMDGGSTWIQSVNVPTMENLLGIDFVNTNIGFICGKGGVIIRTQDGGVNWILLSTPTTQNLCNVSFFDANNGFAIVNSNVNNVLWTNSSGFLWSLSSYTLPPGSSSKMYDSDAIKGTSHAWMIGYHGNILHSTNKGQSWTHITKLYGSSTDSPYGTAIEFYDTNIGYAGGRNGEVYKTIDGGAIWDTLYIGTGERVKYISVINADTVIAIGNNQQLLKTIDGGSTWFPIIDWPRPAFRALGIVDSMNLTVSTFEGDLSRTNDGGSTFSYPGNQSSATKGGIHAIKFYSPTFGLYGGDKGQIAKSINSGMSWYKTNVTGINDLKRIQSIFIYNQNIAWACGGLGNNGRIYKTTDSGENWNEVFTLNDIFYDIYFLSDQIGFAISDDGNIFKCSDGNTNWALIDTLSDHNLRAIDFIDNLNGFVVGYNGIIGKTTDGGNSWEIVDTLNYAGGELSKTDELWDIEFVTGTEGWIAAGNAIAGNGALYHTVDGGHSWDKFDSPNDRSILKLGFISPTCGWASGSFGTILKFVIDSGINKLNSKLPNSIVLHSNYPNPFNPKTNIKYYINNAGNTELIIYNIRGQKVRTIIKDYQTPGNYYFTWDGKNDARKQVSSGIYFYQLKFDNEIYAKRMILLK
jgi:photosystem II stability/assembly factor-like uncharacterized protein